MTGFDYTLEEGQAAAWYVTLSGYHDVEDLNGEMDTHRSLVDVEATMENFEDEYAEETGSSIVRVRGEHGWREFEWANGSIHRYEWSLFIQDWRCPGCGSPDNNLYMVSNDVWASSKLDGMQCFRCLEKAIGRRLTPEDFSAAIPANTSETFHGPELRERIGY